MELKNGYKVIYEEIADGKRTFFADRLDGKAADQIGNAIEIGQFKLVYENKNDGKIYGSESGVPAAGDHCFSEFDKVFVETEEEQTEPVQPEPEEPVVNDPVTNEPENTEPEDEEEPEGDPEEE